MLSKQSTTLLTATLFGLLQGAHAAPSARSTEFPTCIQECIRSSGCFSDFDSCVCEKASDGILSDIASCINQGCPTTTTVLDLIQPLESTCKLSDSAVSAAEKIGGISSDGGDNDEPTTTSSSQEQEPTAATSTKLTSTAAVGAPVTAGGDTTLTTSTRDTTMTTSTRAASATDVIPTDIATVSSLVVAQSTPPVPSPSATSGSLTGSSESDSNGDSDSSSSSSSSSPSSSSANDNGESGAGAVSPMSMLGVVAAIGAAVVLI
ncbi:hypothetical protein F5Y18DRAFT_42060 [Xylariaceae sp. FL1019]|nr:hypothetical protein F5Y18DRAFT_42060 [Xylariaceae sp. FL1019]